MAENLRSVTIKLHPALFAQVQLIAQKRGETMSDTLRHLIKKGLAERVYEENTELIALVVREQMEQVVRSYSLRPSLDNVECEENVPFQERIRPRRNHLYS